MTIVPYSRDLLAGILEAYNLQFEDEPFAARLTPDLFLDLVESKSHFDPEGFLVALNGDEVVGWIHACTGAGTEVWQNPSQKTGRIVMLVFPPSKLPIGAALVQQAVAWLSSQIGGVMEAMHPVNGYPFYRGIFFGGEPMAPATLPHVHLVLETNGFSPAFQSVFMKAELQSVSLPMSNTAWDYVDQPAQMAHASMGESWTGFQPRQTEARLGNKTVGILRWVVLMEACTKLGSPMLNIWGLEVNPEFQRQGVASALIGSVLRHELCHGVRDASLATQLDNVAAHATYARFGFIPIRMLIGRTRPSTSEVRST
jgi:GNAT superfamily N-acetyltransferase